MVLFMAVSQLSAQTPDTVRIYANIPGSGAPTIEQVIMADTATGGVPAHPNRVWLLQQVASVDTPYYFSDPISIKGSVTIVGRQNPITGMPPAIQPWIRLNNTSPSNFIVERGDSATVILKNLYVVGQRYDSAQAVSNLINVSGKHVEVNVNHCVIDNSNGNLANYTGTNGIFIARNCEMRNVSNQFWRAGCLFWSNSPNIMDSVVIQNNTFFLLGRSIYGGPYPFRYLLLDHNTLFFSSDGPLLSTHQVNATITNNIFYGTDAHAVDSIMIVGSPGPVNDAHEPYGVVMMDSLKGYETDFGSESARKVTLTNNAYFWPHQLTDFWQSINDTATGWYLAPPTWMNPQTAAMFNDHTNWPGFVSDKNDSADPGFDPTLVSMSADSLTKFEFLVGWRTPYGSWADAGSFRWWQLWTDPYPFNVFNRVPSTWTGWADGYPVPENLTYSNSDMQTAGIDKYALGDLNWFPAQMKLWEEGGVNAVTPRQVPTKFELAQNYPNPFNPSTKIRVSLNRAGKFSLEIYNVLGQLIQVVDRGFKPAGEYIYNVSMDRFATGVYFYTLRQGSNSVTKKMLLLK